MKWHIPLVVIHIHVGRCTELLVIAGALDCSRLVQSRPQSGQDHARKDGDNGNYDEEFHERKTGRFTLQ